ncbi:MAG: hypothetical protein ABJG42_24495 [Vibrio splendidus]
MSDKSERLLQELSLKLDLTGMYLPVETLEHLKFSIDKPVPKKFLKQASQTSPKLEVDALTIFNLLEALQNDVATLMAIRLQLLAKLNEVIPRDNKFIE